MKANIEFPVMTSGTPPRTRGEKIVMARSSGLFEIAEHERAEIMLRIDGLPSVAKTVALIDNRPHELIADARTFADPDYLRHQMTAAMTRDVADRRTRTPWEPLEFRHSAILRRLRAQNPNSLKSRLHPEVAFEAAMNIDRMIGHILLSSQNGKNRSLPTYSELADVKGLDASAFDRALDEMTETCQHLALVDGALWRECSAPYVEIVAQPQMTPGAGQEVHVSGTINTIPHFVSLRHRAEHARVPAAMFCGMDQIDEASATMEDIIRRGLPGGREIRRHLPNATIGRIIPDDTSILRLGLVHSAIKACTAFGLHIASTVLDHGAPEADSFAVYRNLPDIQETDFIRSRTLASLVASEKEDDDTMETVAAELTDFNTAILASADWSYLPGYTADVVRRNIEQWDMRPTSVPTRGLLPPH